MKTESDLTSCEVQRDLCAQFLKEQRRQGLRLKLVGEHFDDEGLSGASLDRPALQRLLSLLRSKRIKAVVVHRLDRLSRRVVDCAALLEEFKQLEVQFFVASMPELAGGAYGTLLLNLLSTFAEFEREMIASRIAERRAGLIARGRRIAGAVAFGYSADQKTTQLVPVRTKRRLCERCSNSSRPAFFHLKLRGSPARKAGEPGVVGFGPRARYSIRLRILSTWVGSEPQVECAPAYTRQSSARTPSMSAPRLSLLDGREALGRELGRTGRRWRARSDARGAAGRWVSTP